MLLTTEQRIHQRYIFLREAKYPNREIYHYLASTHNGQMKTMTMDEREAFIYTANPQNQSKVNDHGIFR